MTRRAAVGLLIFTSIACRTVAPAPIHETFRTPALAGAAMYSVFLPPSYRASTRRYPVLYFLHDVYGSRDVLFQKGDLAALARAMEEGTIPKFLIVCPEGDGSWFSNFHDGSRRYEDLVAFDLPADVESKYRVTAGVAQRGITGISMGGYAAAKIAFHHPDRFGSVSSLSGALIPMAWEDVDLLFFLARWQMHRVFGRSPNDNSLLENDLWRMWSEGEQVRAPFDMFLLAGTHDKYRLDRVALQYADYLNRHGVHAIAKTEPGIHDWPYWKTAFLEIARWHGEKFLTASPP